MRLALFNERPTVGKSDLTPLRESNYQAGMRNIHAVVKGEGAVSATVRLYGCNDPRYPVEILTFTLSGNGTVSDSAKDNFPFEFYQAEVVAISGVGARVSLIASI